MQELSIDERRKICEKCPITNEVSTEAKAGFIRGCGCHILIKMRNRTNHCIAGKW